MSFRIHFRSQEQCFPEKIEIKTIEGDPCNTDYTQLGGETFTVPIERSKANDTAWIPLSLEFSTKSGAEYLVIGSFERKPNVRKKRNNGIEHGVYAFIDDMKLVNLTPIAETAVRARATATNTTHGFLDCAAIVIAAN